MMMNKPGWYSFFSSRNNNFSNRQNIGIICVGSHCKLMNGTVSQPVNQSVNLISMNLVVVIDVIGVIVVFNALFISILSMLSSCFHIPTCCVICLAFDWIIASLLHLLWSFDDCHDCGICLGCSARHQPWYCGYCNGQFSHIQVLGHC